MSSIDSKGENEYSDDESNIVGKSGEEGDEQVSYRIKKEIRKDTDIGTQENNPVDWINLIFVEFLEYIINLIILLHILLESIVSFNFVTLQKSLSY